MMHVYEQVEENLEKKVKILADDVILSCCIHRILFELKLLK